jgi:hypothetical protein
MPAALLIPVGEGMGCTHVHPLKLITLNARALVDWRYWKVVLDEGSCV